MDREERLQTHPSHSIRSCQAQYLQDAKELGVNPLYFDADFDVLQPFQQLEGDGALQIPSSSWRGDEVPEAGSPVQNDSVGADSTAGRKKRRKRGRGGTKQAQRAHRGQGGFADKWAHRDFRLKKRALEKGKMYRTDRFSLRLDSSRTGTGSHGLNPPELAQAEIHRLFFSGEIKAHFAGFQPVPESGDAPAMFVDSEDIMFAFRTSRVALLEDVAPELLDAITKLIRPELMSEATQQQCLDNIRGSHYFIGHHKQDSETPTLTDWHKKSIPLVEDFLNTPAIEKIIRWVSKMVEMYFPGVAARFHECAQWHEENHGIKPLFGLFFNLCINGIFSGQPRIFSAPHAAHSKNDVGVCALLIYQLQGTSFNQSQRCWFVLWEAGIIIELPPWVLFLYPSSLLYRFNLDVHDIQFITTDGDWPTQSNSKPIEVNDEIGMGSLIFFNEVSLYQSCETGNGSLPVARDVGMTGTADSNSSELDSDVLRAFQKYGQMLDLRKPPPESPHGK